MNALDAMYVGLAGVTAPIWMRKARGGWRERFGRVDPVWGGEASHPRIMLHAVSVGEVNALRSLVPMLAPHARVVVTATTDTGLDRAKALYADEATVLRYPLDFSWSVGRFLDRVRPDVVGLVELEVWPNFVRMCTSRGIPVGVINGRLSERSFRGYRKVRRWIGRSFGALAFAGVQDEAYAERFVAMGVPPDRVSVTGSMKWDHAGGAKSGATAEELRRAMGIDPSRPLIVGASTAEGEESLLHKACPPDAQLLCAPRRPERFDEAASALPGCVRRSGGGGSSPETGGADRFLLDTIGELSAAYELADIVVIGRTFGNLYGSDPAEPAALGRPVVVGPAFGNFTSAVAALESGGGLLRADVDNLSRVLGELVENPSRRVEIGRLAREEVGRRQGASGRHASILLEAAGVGGGVGEPAGGWTCAPSDSER